MKNKILNALTNNWGFKLLALIGAFTLWLMVYNLEDPTKTITMSLQVSVINKESVESLNKYYEVIDGTNKVTFSVTAPRSVLEKLDENDFSAVADMEYMTINEDGVTGSTPIDIKCTVNTAEPVKLSSTSKVLRVKLEDLMTKQFIVSANAVGEVLDGYALAGLTVTAPNVVRVSGPASIVQKISAAVATIDVEGMNADITPEAMVVLYDGEGREIDQTRLSLSNEKVNVSATILKIKEVPILVKPSGNPADGYMMTTITSSPTTITLMGTKASLNAISAIEIPSELVSVAGASSDVVASIDISDYIPYGAELLDKDDANVEITVGIGRIRNKVFSVATQNIMVTGLPTGAEYQFAHTNVAVMISGLEEDIAQLQGTDINGSVDVSQLENGLHQVELILDIDGTKYTHSDVKVLIRIIMETPEEPSEDPSEEPGENPSEEEGENSTEESTESEARIRQ